MLTNFIRKFFQLEAAGGILLFAAAVLAVIFNNADTLRPFYHTVFHAPFFIGPVHSAHSLTHWINDGLMAIFFLLVGLEIKREILKGELSTPSSLILPAFAALGGMVVPALIYYTFNQTDPIAAQGWAIPAATDIAFALGVLTLLGSRAPLSLKIFLTALAILDDLAAILIIALFYTAELSFSALGLAAVALAVLFGMNKIGVGRFWPYGLVGLMLWFFVLNSGIHATLAGVLLAFTIPTDETPDEHSLLEDTEHTLHPWVAFLILPLFAFANAGLPLEAMSLAALTNPVPLGIAAGLFIGKQIGVFGATWLAVKLGLSKLPEDVNWMGIYGVSILCGIGFTMSLFIGSLAFQGMDERYISLVQLGVFSGSLLAMVYGYLVLLLAGKK